MIRILIAIVAVGALGSAAYKVLVIDTRPVIELAPVDSQWLPDIPRCGDDATAVLVPPGNRWVCRPLAQCGEGEISVTIHGPNYPSDNQWVCGKPTPSLCCAMNDHGGTCWC